MERELVNEQPKREANPTEKIVEAIRSEDVDHLLQTLTTVNAELGCAESAHFQPERGTAVLRKLLEEFLEKAGKNDSAGVLIYLGDGSSRIILDTKKLEGTQIDVDLYSGSSSKVKERWAQLHE